MFVPRCLVIKIMGRTFSACSPTRDPRKKCLPSGGHTLDVPTMLTMIILPHLRYAIRVILPIFPIHSHSPGVAGFFHACVRVIFSINNGGVKSQHTTLAPRG